MVTGRSHRSNKLEMNAISTGFVLVPLPKGSRAPRTRMDGTLIACQARYSCASLSIVALVLGCVMISTARAFP